MQRSRNTAPSPVSETLRVVRCSKRTPNPIFEAQYAFAHRRPRQTDTFRRRGKALCLGDVNKSVNVPHSFDCHCLSPLTFSAREDSGAIGARNSPVMGNLEYFRLAALRISVFLG